MESYNVKIKFIHILKSLELDAQQNEMLYLMFCNSSFELTEIVI